MTLLARLSRRAALPLALLAALAVVPGCMMSRPNVYTGGGGGYGSVLLLNQTDTAIHYVYVSSCSNNSWGEDQLGDAEVIMPGNSRTFSMSPGCWDLKAEFSDGRTLEERGVTIASCGSRTWTLST